MGSPQTLDYRGCRLSYAVRGEGPPVLFIQGTGTHGDGWRPQVDELSARFHCLTFDNRGMANSQPHHGPLTVEQLAEDARALLDRTEPGDGLTLRVASSTTYQPGVGVRTRRRALARWLDRASTRAGCPASRPQPGATLYIRARKGCGAAHSLDVVDGVANSDWYAANAPPRLPEISNATVGSSDGRLGWVGGKSHPPVRARSR